MTYRLTRQQKHDIRITQHDTRYQTGRRFARSLYIAMVRSGEYPVAAYKVLVVTCYNYRASNGHFGVGDYAWSDGVMSFVTSLDIRNKRSPKYDS